MSLYEMRNTVAGKAVGFVAALALVAVLSFSVAFNAQAQSDEDVTVEDLAEIIADPEEEIAALQALLVGDSPASVGGDFDPFFLSMGIGSTGAEVMELQQFLNANGFTVAVAGAGSPGM